MDIGDFLKYLASEIEQAGRLIERAGRLELEQQRILQGRCPRCNIKLPANNPSYHCVPDCVSQVAAPCVYCGVETTNKDAYDNYCCPSCEVTLS